MKKHCSIVAAVTLALTVVASAAVPAFNVTVVDSSGKSAFKRATDLRGILASPRMPSGNYAVQFTSNSAPKGSHYTLVVVAGLKKTARSEERRVGKACRAGWGKSELKSKVSIQGQVSAESAETRIGKNGHLKVCIPNKFGS